MNRYSPPVFTRGEPQTVSETLCQICILKYKRCEKSKTLILLNSVPRTARYIIMIIHVHICLQFKNHFSIAVNRTDGISKLHKLRDTEYNYSLLVQNNQVINRNFFITLLICEFLSSPRCAIS